MKARPAFWSLSLGKAGTLTLTLVTVKSLEHAEDCLIFAPSTDDGEPLEEEAVRRLFAVPAQVIGEMPDEGDNGRLNKILPCGYMQALHGPTI